MRTCKGYSGLVCAAALLAALCGGPSAAAAPSVSSVSGDVTQGSSITISGSSFGSGPSGVVFDDFEGGTVGNSIMTGAGSATVGQWDSTDHSNYYTDDHSVSGSLAFEADMGVHYLNYIRRTFPAGTSELFASWWVRIPDPIPGEGNPSGTNWKHIWIQGSSSADDDVYWIYFRDPPSTQAHIGGNSGVVDGWMWSMPTFQKGDWIRGSIYVKGGVTNGRHDTEMLHENGTRQSWSVTGQTWGGVMPYEYRDIRFNAYGRSTSGSYPVHDDCYSAYGPNCRARVEIGNNPVYANCTDLAISGPTSWSGTSITAKCNVGGLDRLDDWYLFVIDAAGSVSPGYLVAGSRTLTVTNGSGSGLYAPGAVVPISANPAASGKRFAIWVGDYTHVTDRFQASTTVTMPATDITVIAAYINVYMLTVNSGSGDGQYSAGAVVNIDADPAASGKEFDQWSGDIAGVADTESASTTFTMAATDADVTATYADIPPAYWPGDVDQSLLVSGPDLDIILTQWGRAGTEITDPRADISGDGLVSGPDLDIILTDWGKTGSPP